MEEGLNIVVTPGKSLKAAFHEVLILPCEVLATNEIRRERVSGFGHAELDRTASNRFLHLPKLDGLQDDEDEGEDEGDSAEVPVSHHIAKLFLLINDEQAEESCSRASYKNEGEPVME